MTITLSIIGRSLLLLSFYTLPVFFFTFTKITVFLGISWYFLVASTRARATKDTFIGRFIGTRDSRFTVVTKRSLNGRKKRKRSKREKTFERCKTIIDLVKHRGNQIDDRSFRPLEKRGLSRARQTVAAV